MRFKTQTLVLVLVPGFFNLALAAFMFVAFLRVSKEAQLNANSREILLAQTKMQELVERITNEEDYLLGINKASRVSMHALIGELESKGSELLGLLRQNKSTESTVGNFQNVLNDLTAILNESLKNKAQDRILTLSTRREQCRSEFLELLFKIERAESALAVDLTKRTSDQLALLLSSLLVLVVFNECLMLYLGFSFSKRTLERIGNLRRSAKALAGGGTVPSLLSAGDELYDVSESLQQASQLLSLANKQQQIAVEKVALSEKNLRSMMESLSFGVAEISNLGRIIFANKAFCRLLKIEKSKVFGLTLYNFINEIGEDDFYSNTSKDCKLLSSDGLDTWVRVAFTRLQLQDDQTFLISLIDISDEKQMQRIKQDFTNMVVHDLRTPLAAIKGSMQLFQAGVYGAVSAESSSQYERIERSTSRLVKLINDLLAVEKLESGTLELRIGTCDTKAVVDLAVSAVADLAALSSVRITTKVPNIEFGADQDRLVQALVNLLGNAIEFSPPNSTIAVEVQYGAGLLVFRVVDSGRGIPTDVVDKVFDRFYQVEPGRESERKGSGLGLAIAKSIIESHGGKIACSNNRDSVGATFAFTIPIDLV